MKVYHIWLADPGSGMDGGTMCALELIKCFRGKGLINVLLTTDVSRRRLEGLGFREDAGLRYFTIETDPSGKEGLALFADYVRRVLRFLVEKDSALSEVEAGEDVLICHCPFFPSTIPFKLLSKSFEKDPIFWFHMPCPGVFRGYEGHFTGELRLPPSLSLVHYKLNELLARSLSRGSIVVVDNPDHGSIFPRSRIRYIPPGASVGGSALSDLEPAYDLAFMGRFHAQKGLFEVPGILKILKKSKRDIRLLLIGDGEARLKEKFFKALKDEGLEDNVEAVGYVYGEARFRYISRARVFIFPSLYEGFGIAALEAMACGLPVVAYDLPVFDVFTAGMVKVPVSDGRRMAEETLCLIEDRERYEAAALSAREFSSMLTWDRTGEAFYELVTEGLEGGGRLSRSVG